MTRVPGQELVWESTPQQVVAGLPSGVYETNRQPTYSDPAALKSAIEQVQNIEPVATSESILALRRRLGDIALGLSDAVLVIEGNCDEPVGVCTPAQLAHDMQDRRDVVYSSAIGSNVLLVERALCQATKPRTSGTENVSGRSLPAYMGTMVNGKAIEDRQPDPGRMVVAAQQAQRVQAILRRGGQAAISAHEALLLPFEQGRMASDRRTSARFLLSADLPWIGDRTSAPDGQHVQMLRGVENAIGIKVGDQTTPETVAAWAQQLNPNHLPGKLVFMMRISPDRADVLERTVKAIKQHAPHAIIVYDIHAVTKPINGHKIRAVADIIAGVYQLIDACDRHGLTMHGVHLEAMSDDEQRQCVETERDTPSHKPSVDPQLNLMQLRRILDACAERLQRRRVLA